MSTEIQLLFKC